MKYILFLFSLLFFSVAISAQNCPTDSVVKILKRDRGDAFANTFLTDSFDIVNGIELYSMSPFSRKYFTLNTNHDTLLYIVTTGTGSGYVNTQKIEFSYSPGSNLILTRTEYTGVGTLWNVRKTETWNYNANDLLTDYVHTDSAGNVHQIQYTYSGNARLSILHQTGSGASWQNDRLFTIVYTSGIRDSLLLQRWDLLSSTWVDSLAAKYDSSSQFYATLADTVYQGGNTLINTYTYDTLDVLREEYHYTDQGGQYPVNETIQYNTIHAHWVMTRDIVVSNGCVNSEGNYWYDPYGVQTGHTFEGHCGIGSGGSHTVSYDSSYRIIHEYSNYWSSVSDITHFWDYFYFPAGTVGVNCLPLGTLQATSTLCMGDSIVPTILLGGGCGPYTYAWTPSQGLSSDTVLLPKIALSNDTVTYTLTVTDSIGQSGQATFSAFPAFTVRISFDTSACSGCPVVLHASLVSGGVYQWYRNDTAIQNAYGADYTAINSGTYYVSVRKQTCTIVSDSIVLTLSGLTRIRGRIYWDRDSDCTYTVVDTGMSTFGFRPFLFSLSTVNYIAYFSPDSTGYFDLPLDTGTFVIRLYNPATQLAPVCTGADSFTFNVPSFGDTITGIDFPLKGDTSCKRLEVKVSSSQFRPCFPANVVIWYFNAGLTDENNAVVTITMPVELTITSSSLPYSVAGDTLTFQLPVLSPGGTGAITLSTDVSCSPALANATLCFDATISPKDFCSLHPDSSWDQSNIRVRSYCDNDSAVCFILANESLSANGNMSTASNWRLFEDNLPIQQGTFLLNANADTTLCFVSNGSTYRLEANQAAGFPTATTTSASIERCGSGNYSLNEILNHYLPESLPFYYSYCHRITSSFDPNTKSVQPEGLGPDHFIPSGQELKYRIDFQNTGNDSALYIQIADYLRSDIFDISSISFSGSSHPCQYEYNNNILTFKFYNIHLPDSTTDPIGSHGYVEFCIRSLEGLVNGRWIRNFAQIIFDSNNPVQTTIVTNTICNVVNPLVDIHADTGFCIGTTLICRTNILHGGSGSGRIINWYKNGVLLGPHLDSLVYTGIQLNDTIWCTVKSAETCAYPQTVESNKIIFDHYSVSTPLITFQTPDLISSTANAYQWFFNQSILTGATNQNYTPVNSGSYQVQVWDSNGCTSISDPYPFINTMTGALTTNPISIFPNPACDYLTIESKKTIKTIRIIDIIGREILLSRNVNETSAHLNIKNIAPGRYILEISNAEGKNFEPLLILREN